MKKRKFEKRKIVVLATCVCAILCGTTVYALVQSDEAIRDKKLAEIDNYEKQAKSLMEADANTDDADKRQELKDQLGTVLDKKMKLEIETNSYDYKGELEISIHSVLTAVEDSERFLKENPEKLSKKGEKRLSALRNLCQKYEKELESCEDYKKLLENYRRELDEIYNNYR
ncbi:MAG: hypothetical protein NC293_04850 [Roseburia sp.]|nr:hypothetical protein [Roseburia sp.]